MKKLIDIGDRTATVLSLLCTFHCIAGRLVLVILPSVTSLLAFDPELLHIWLLFAVIPISLFTIFIGYIHHRRATISTITIVGLLLLIFAVVFGHDLGHGWEEPLLTVVGSLFVAFGHIRSLTIRKSTSYKSAVNT